MNWRDLIGSEMEHTYCVTEKLLDLVEDGKLDWKPGTGANWMTAGQLLQHLTEACGAAFAAFVTDDWRMPDGADLRDLPPEAMMPTAEVLPAIASVAEARRLLAADRELARRMLERASDEELAGKITIAPWEPEVKMVLGQRLLQMVDHLRQHKGQLFYYLKLQGHPVHTGHLWG